MIVKINGDVVPDTIKGAVEQAKDHVIDRVIDYGSSVHDMVVDPSLPHYGATVKSMFMVHTQAMADTCDIAVVAGKTALHTGLEILSYVF